jgi:rSAM/selenodomain-associated transferase 2
VTGIGQPAAPRFSIVIPTFNEAACIARTVAGCRALMPAPEVIVADGASTDGTAALAAQAGARVVASPRRGRSYQMNAGAAASRGEWLVFLHADASIPPVAWAELERRTRQAAFTFGGYRRRWEPPSRLLDLGSRLAVWRGRIWNVFLGDQAIFVRREAFEGAGGYAPILLFEDVDLCRRLRRAGRGVMMREAVVASRRRFQTEGDLQRWARNVALWLRYSFGAHPDRLARIYYPGYYEAVAAREIPESPGSGAESIESTPDESRASRAARPRSGDRGE